MVCVRYLWGLFKKVVIADNCAEFANQIFNNSADMNGSTLVLGAIFFTFQIYGDFSGYSDIAIGTSRLFGFDLKQNFATPYFSRDIAEFWRRWHISLSTWFRDYLYIPLGGSRGGTWMKVRNTFAIFLVSGFWHGANWTFIIWGALNAIYFLPLLLTNNNRKNLGVVAEGKLLPSFRELFAMLTTFMLTVFAWIFFRAENIEHALNIIKLIFNFESWLVFEISYARLLVLFFISILLIVEWINRSELHGLKNLPKQQILRKILYVILIIIIFSQSNNSSDFIYFQF